METQQVELAGLDRARAIHVAALNDGDANAWRPASTPTPSRCPPTSRPTSAPKASSSGRKDFWLRSARASQSSRTMSSSRAGLGLRTWLLRDQPHTQSGGRHAPRQRQVHHHIPATAGARLADSPRHLEQRQPAIEAARRLNALIERRPAAWLNHGARRPMRQRPMTRRQDRRWDSRRSTGRW